MTYWIVYSIALIGMVLFIIINPDNTQIGMIVVFVLLSKFGTCASFNICYLATYSLFPVGISGNCYGICNLIARIASVLGPLAAEI